MENRRLLRRERYKAASLMNWGLFEIVLFTLTLIEGLSRIYLFTTLSWFSSFMNYVQIPMYAALLFLIIWKESNPRQLMVFALLAFLLFFGMLRSGYASYSKALLLIFAAKDVPYKKIMRVSRMALLFSFVLSFILWIFGISDAGIGRRNAISFGYGQPNITGQIIMIIVFLWLVEKGDVLALRNYIFVEIIGLITYATTKSRSACFSILILPFMVELVKFFMNTISASRILQCLLEFSQLAIMAFTYFSAKMLPDSLFLQDLNELFSDRLFLNYYALDRYKITLFGQELAIPEGQIYNEIAHRYQGVTIDCTYVTSLIVVGLIPMTIFLLGYYILMKRAIRNRNYAIIAVALFLAIYAFSESQMADIFYNFVYYYVLASNDDPVPEKENLLRTGFHRRERYKSTKRRPMHTKQ